MVEHSTRPEVWLVSQDGTLQAAQAFPTEASARRHVDRYGGLLWKATRLQSSDPTASADEPMEGSG